MKFENLEKFKKKVIYRENKHKHVLFTLEHKRKI